MFQRWYWSAREQEAHDYSDQGGQGVTYGLAHDDKNATITAGPWIDLTPRLTRAHFDPTYLGHMWPRPLLELVVDYYGGPLSYRRLYCNMTATDSRTDDGVQWMSPWMFGVTGIDRTRLFLHPMLGVRQFCTSNYLVRRGAMDTIHHLMPNHLSRQHALDHIMKKLASDSLVTVDPSRYDVMCFSLWSAFDRYVCDSTGGPSDITWVDRYTGRFRMEHLLWGHHLYHAMRDLHAPPCTLGDSIKPSSELYRLPPFSSSQSAITNTPADLSGHIQAWYLTRVCTQSLINNIMKRISQTQMLWQKMNHGRP